MKAVQYWHKTTQTDQWNRTKSGNRPTYIYRQLNFLIKVKKKTIELRKDSLSKSGSRTIGSPYAGK